MGLLGDALGSAAAAAAPSFDGKIVEMPDLVITSSEENPISLKANKKNPVYIAEKVSKKKQILELAKIIYYCQDLASCKSTNTEAKKSIMWAEDFFAAAIQKGYGSVIEETSEEKKGSSSSSAKKSK